MNLFCPLVPGARTNLRQLRQFTNSVIDQAPVARRTGAIGAVIPFIPFIPFGEVVVVADVEVPMGAAEGLVAGGAGEGSPLVVQRVEGAHVLAVQDRTHPRQISSRDPLRGAADRGLNDEQAIGSQGQRCRGLVTEAAGKGYPDVVLGMVCARPSPA